MPNATYIFEGLYLADILDQPRAINASIDGLPNPVPASSTLATLASELAAGRFRRVVLTGMGSSLHALYPLHRTLVQFGIASFWVETAELLLGFDSLYRADTLLVAVSQSGDSAEIIRLLERRAEFGHVVGVTNNDRSHLGRLSGSTLLLHAGAESTVSCKTYVATLAVLHWLGGLLCQADLGALRDDLASATAGVRDYLPRWREHVAELLPLVRGVRSIFVTGRGDSLSTAGTAGLTLKESTRTHAEGMSCAAFRHGPLEMVADDVLVVVFAGDPRVAGLNRRLVHDILQSGGRAVLSDSVDASSPALRLPAVPMAVRSIVEILPVQMLSLAVAARDGREAGRFEHATKVTATE